MADRWLYVHAGAAHGPVDTDKLAQLATLGKLLPTDPVWAAGEDMRGAVEAQTLLNAEVFPNSPSKVEEALASPPQPANATPDWLSDADALSAPVPAYSPDVEVVDESPDVEVVDESPDVEVVMAEVVPKAPPPKPGNAPKLASPVMPKRPVAPKARPAPPTQRTTDNEEADESDDSDEASFGLKRRDLLMFGLGVIGVGLAVAAGLYFAKRSQLSDDDPPKDD